MFPSLISASKSSSPEAQSNVTLFGVRVPADIISRDEVSPVGGCRSSLLLSLEEVCVWTQKRTEAEGEVHRQGQADASVLEVPKLEDALRFGVWGPDYRFTCKVAFSSFTVSCWPSVTKEMRIQIFFFFGGGTWATSSSAKE